MENIAYLAGVVDGEGSIYIFSYKNKKSGEISTPTLQMSITNTHMGLLEKCNEIIEKEILKAKLTRKIFDSKNKTKNKTCFRLAVSNYKQIISILKAIQPYIIAKKQQVILGIKFAELSSQRGAITREEQITMMYQMKELNGRKITQRRDYTSNIRKDEDIVRSA